MKPEVKIFKDANAVASAYAEFLRNLQGEKEKLTVSLSGGSTPKLLFDVLAAEYATSIDWGGLHFFWGDERCVPPDHGESNFKMTKEHLLDHINMPASQVHRVYGEDDPVQEAIRYSKELIANTQSNHGLPSLDLMILGMGDDGHTASIFPDNMGLLSSTEICEVANHPDSGQQRVTMTGPVLNNSEIVTFLVTGEKKAQKVRSILNQEPMAKDFPASHISGRRLMWFLDEAAASLIQ